MPHEIRTEPVIEALRQPLALLDDERRATVAAYLDTARTPVERAIFDVMSQLVQEIGDRTGDHYRMRLAYRSGGLALEVEEKVQDGDEARWAAMEGDVEKITIRIPAELKDLATQAAAQAGTSANSWFIKALARALRHVESQQSDRRSWGGKHDRGHRRDSGSHFTGWVGGDDDR